MLENSILIAEDDVVSAKVMEKVLTNVGYKIDLAQDGEQALEIYHKKLHPVVISDLNMPRISGLELINQLKDLEPAPIIIVQTALEETDTVIETMKKGVYDYIVKPVNSEDLIHKVDKAFEIARFREIKRDVEREYEIKLDKQLSWNSWKENIYSRDRHRFDRSLFHNMKTILTQGIGFGGLLSLIPLIISQGKNSKSGRYEIDDQIMNLIQSNVNMAQKALEMFKNIDNILHTDYQFEPITIQEIHDQLHGIIQKCQPLAEIKNQSIKLSDSKSIFNKKNILMDIKLFKMALEELIVNSLKFSVENSTILILMTIVKNSLFIAFLSESIVQKGEKGIPEQYNAIIFEPFFRLDSNVDERFSSLDYGLGLSMVEKIIHKFNGKINATNVQSHMASLGKGEDSRVKIEVELPLQ